MHHRRHTTSEMKREVWSFDSMAVSYSPLGTDGGADVDQIRFTSFRVARERAKRCTGVPATRNVEGLQSSHL